MKRLAAALAAIACMTMINPCFGKQAVKADAKAMDSLSYCLGANISMSIRQQLGAISLGLSDIKSGVDKAYTRKSKQTHNEAVEVLRQFFSGEEFAKRRAAYEEAVKAGSTAPFNPFTSKKERKEVSYAFGNDLGSNILRANLPIQLSWLWRGFEEAWNDKSAISAEQVVHYLSHYFMTVAPQQNDARSKAWLQKKKAEVGVKSTESGLLYKVIEAGDMSKAAKSDADVVKVHYVGRLQDGRVFDASRFESRSEEQKAVIRMNYPHNFDKNGKLLEVEQPLEIPLNRVIAGWAEGMKLIGPGGKILLYVPAELAYGNRGAGGDIGPNEALEFEVELIEVIPTK